MNNEIIVMPFDDTLLYGSLTPFQYMRKHKIINAIFSGESSIKVGNNAFEPWSIILVATNDVTEEDAKKICMSWW